MTQQNDIICDSIDEMPENGSRLNFLWNKLYRWYNRWYKHKKEGIQVTINTSKGKISSFLVTFRRKF